ncbi:MAG: ABC transporter substrate-binding protein [Deltaproteobacteria bacterium]|nr:ABC transporter substrate-binding protein [Deltaproteobacteria bacterium]
MLFMFFGSTTSLAVVPILEQKKIPVITVATAVDVSKDRKYVMNMWPTAQMENSVVVDEVKRRGYKTCAVVATNQDGMLALQDAFLKSNACTVAYSESFNANELDFQSSIMKIRQKNIEAVYNILVASQGGNLAKQLRQLGYQDQLFSVHQAENPAEVKLADGDLLGTWFSSNNIMTSDLFKRVEKKQGYAPIYLVE